MYDFDAAVPRGGVGAAKWEQAAAEGCPPGVFPFTVADMEFATAPEVVAAAVKTAEGGRWGYTCASDGFFEAVRGWMQARHGWEAQQAWMVTTPGVVPALYAAVAALTRPGDGVLVQPPVYPPFLAAAAQGKRRCVQNPLVLKNGRYEMDFEGLAKAAKSCRLMLFCSPHNPVGRVWSEQEVRRVAEICAENGVILVADEIHCDIVFPPAAFFSVGRLGEAALGNAVLATSACKTFSLAGLACAACFVPSAALRARFEARLSETGTEMNSAFGVPATKAAYECGGPWLEALLAYLAGNAAAMREYLRQKCPKIKMMPMEGTTLAWLDFGAYGLGEEKLHRLLREKAQFYATPGERFGPGGEGFVRVNLAVPRAVLMDAVARVAAALG